ncbi:heme exporter protein CcmB [Kordiimonas sp. SCSIO 12610]|uniref:heme exporter protein CcmB n=1 Tax=Kordiimonas sp. SCSIO 12610 TaxID=2829597 RepID=UPI00210877C2|nr:heme exporter protein CcmB [Kordiimonas sp. SCSIO 12610]UTW55632.1 heme exporter protein CcmB [Kordiimonas sp. SCSIO 12610]
MTSPSLLTIFTALIQRDIKLAWSQGGAGGMTLGFFLIAISLFPLGIGPEASTLAKISSGVIWVIALLACLLSLDRLFQADFEDGTLDDLSLSPINFELIVIAKAIAHWSATILPIIIFAPLLAALLNMPEVGYKMLLISLLIGTPALSLIGSIGAALTVALRRGGVLLTLLVLPLYIPTLIFGVGAIEASITLTDPAPHLALTGAVTLVALIISPFASAAALRLALE